MHLVYNSRNLSGRALYLAIVISFVSFVLALLFILSRYYSSIELIRIRQSLALNDHVSSAINIAMQKPDFVPFNEEKQLNLLGDSSITTSIQKKRWGLFQVITAGAEWKKLSEKRIVMTGAISGGKDATGLYLTDHGHYLAVGGDTYLSGICYLPELGGRKAYIDGKSFRYSNIVQGEIRKSNPKLPEISADLKEYLEKDLFAGVQENDSIADESLLDKEIPERSFLKDPVRIISEGLIVLSDLEISGNYIIQSAKKIIISDDAIFRNIICIAPIIDLSDGVVGTGQFIALDTLLAGTDVDLQYPSSLVISGFGRSKMYMAIGENCRIAGSILLFGSSEEVPQGKEQAEVVLNIEKDTEISGQVYCSGKISHKGINFGSMYCDRLFLQTRQGYYENHLLDAWVDPVNLEPSFASGIIMQEDARTRMQIIQTLN